MRFESVTESHTKANKWERVMKFYYGFFEATWFNKYGKHVSVKASSKAEAKQKMTAMDCAHGQLLFVTEA